MPNLPVLVGEGMTIITYNAGMEDSDIKYVKLLFEEFGRVEEMDESLLSTVISLTASSPAYVFMLLEAMAASAVKTGLPLELAYKISAQSILGSAKMYLEDRQNIDSPVNELSVSMDLPDNTSVLFNQNRIRNAVDEAIDACNKKAWEFEKI
jgi:pyrroline-5-carboxylate reductase